MKKAKKLTAKNTFELARVLKLSAADAIEVEFRGSINKKIIASVVEQKITHAELAKLAKTSRPRITALLNERREDISTDLMLRVLACLGYAPRISFKKLAG